MAIYLDRVPSDGFEPTGVVIEIPSVHRLTGLTQAIDVQDSCQIIQPTLRRVLERFPHAAFRELGIAGQHPHAVRQSIESLAG